MADGGNTAQAVIVNLPNFLHHFGKIGHPLAAEVMAQAIDSQSDELVRALAENSGRLVCAFGNMTKVQMVMDTPEIICQHCSSIEEHHQDATDRNLYSVDMNSVIDYQIMCIVNARVKVHILVKFNVLSGQHSPQTRGS